MKKRILVIDDEDAIRKSFKLNLEDAGFMVDTAESGDKGSEMVPHGSYDLILLDLKMPGMDGVRTLREIRKHDAQVPVYLVTAFHQEFFDRLEAARKDAVEFELLKKPIGSAQLIAVARSVLEGPVRY